MDHVCPQLGGSLIKRDYNKSHCYQYEMRLQNLQDDLAQANLTFEDTQNLSVKDFTFEFVPKEDRPRCDEIKEFITRHEWLGKMPHRPTHRFIATYKNILAGVVIMATPNAFSNLLGSDMRNKEKLISRGACISWSPKNLASSLIMFSIRYMVKNSHYRYFTAYSDTEARELGTIYQACNFTYLGQDSGARFEYFDPHNPDKGWFSDRNFRKTTSYKKYAHQLEIDWQREWSYRDKIYWSEMPEEIQERLKAAAKDHQSSCQRRMIPRKHKYVYILGKSKGETKRLKNLFKSLNPDKVDLSYPKIRGPKENTKQLTERPVPCWPTNIEELNPSKKLYSIKEVATMFGISQWLIYHHVNNDPTFPFVNVGAKKRYLINPDKLEKWLEQKSKRDTLVNHYLPDSGQLLEVGR